ATAFVSVLRLVPAWFPVRRVPLVTQMTGIVGQLGQVISAVPFMAFLLATGWSAAFVSLAGVGLLAAVLVVLVVRDRPGAPASAAATTGEPGAVGPPAPTERGDRPAPGPRPRGPLREVLGEPGTWLGFWTHFVGLFPVNTFMLLWGVPFLTAGQGLGARTAGALLSLGALAGIVIGPVLGELVARHPLRRSWLVLGTCAVVVAMWAGVLLPGTPRPTWQLAGLVMVLAGSGAAANIGFDFARTSVPPARLGTATGVVNAGGFLASLLSILLVGLLLDVVSPGGGYELADFRVAISSHAVLWVLGLAGLLLARRATRRRMAERGVVVPPVRTVLARWRDGRRRGR
ncbi:MFS transporter, partial [Georgenia sp. 10Sc9-8]|nr:MFS transporter [Georgenia halotolerans]